MTGTGAGGGPVATLPWHVRVLAALAEFPDGAPISRLTRLLADGRRHYDSVYRSIYRTLRAFEGTGHAQRAGHLRCLPLGWGQDVPAPGACRPAGLWRITAKGTECLATWPHSGLSTGFSDPAPGRPGQHRRRQPPPRPRPTADAQATSDRVSDLAVCPWDAAQVSIAEIGLDISRFPTPGQLR